MEHKLLPCPMCGGKAEIKHLTRRAGARESSSTIHNFFVQCTSCKLGTDTLTACQVLPHSSAPSFTESECVKLWNKRANEKEAEKPVNITTEVRYYKGELQLKFDRTRCFYIIEQPPHKKVCVYQDESELFELAEKIREVALQAREERRGKLLEKYVDELAKQKGINIGHNEAWAD